MLCRMEYPSPLTLRESWRHFCFTRQSIFRLNGLSSAGLNESRMGVIEFGGSTPFAGEMVRAVGTTTPLSASCFFLNKNDHKQETPLPARHVAPNCRLRLATL